MEIRQGRTLKQCLERHGPRRCWAEACLDFSDIQSGNYLDEPFDGRFVGQFTQHHHHRCTSVNEDYSRG